MAGDFTQQQTTEQRERSRQLSAAPSQPPREVPDYDLHRQLGSGAFGEVWVGIDRTTKRSVAIKFYTHGRGVEWLSLSREVEKLVVLSADRYVVQLLDVGWDSTPPYYVMDYIENGSLEDRLEETGPMTVAAAVEMFREIAEGLQHAHAKGVLHCDLKPANVLLDEDDKPRLADFGQSRLSHEQSPALGTMFYMAPEQADLQAVPDTGWDVYALGCLFYRMLTGAPPHRTEAVVKEIEGAADLEDRLARYRRALQEQPPPTEHRRVPGVDRPLADAINRMLAVDPRDRFSSVEAVLKALDDREAARARRPLVILGLIGPIAILLLAGMFGYRGFEQSMQRSTTGLTEKAAETNRWAAQFAAALVAREINRYFTAVEEVAGNPGFQVHLQATVDFFDKDFDPDDFDPEKIDDTLVDLPAKLADPRQNDQRLAEREAFINHPVRQELQSVMEQLRRGSDLPAADGWFVTNRDGTILAAAFARPPKRSPVGRNFSYRTYYHGGLMDYRTEENEFAPYDARITQTQLSALFTSTATDEWKVAVSAPIHRGGQPEGEFLGVLGLTVDLGKFIQFDSTEQQFAVLVDNRPGEMRGVILQHPLFAHWLRQGKKLPPQVAEYRVDLDQLDKQLVYEDPLVTLPDGQRYAGRWIAAAAPVVLPPRGRGGSSGRASVDTGLVVVVQEAYDAVVEPVRAMGSRLIYEAIAATSFAALLIAGLWAVVVRSFRQPTRAAPPKPAPKSLTTPWLEVDTLQASHPQGKAPNPPRGPMS